MAWSRINVLLAYYFWSQTTVPHFSIEVSRFETQPRTISSATFLWATIYWLSITSPHFWLPVSVSITMLIISLTISISYLAKSSSTLAFQFLDLLSSKHLNTPSYLSHWPSWSYPHVPAFPKNLIPLGILISSISMSDCHFLSCLFCTISFVSTYISLLYSISLSCLQKKPLSPILCL